jgi:arginase family enzyme
MTDLADPPSWSDPSDDPNDEQFGDVVVSAAIEDAGAFDAVLVGEPYDGAVIGRPGAGEGPAALRRELAATKTHQFDAGPVGSVGDLGDIAAIDSEWTTKRSSEVQDAVRAVTARIYDQGGLPVFLGGDNSLTYPNVAPLLERGSVGVVSLDAHLDCRELRGEPTSGTPYRQLHEAGLDAFADEGVEETFVGLILRERGIARHGHDIVADGDVVGHVTSGTMSPTLGEPIALGYVPTSLAEPGTELSVVVRDREKRAEVVTTPFIEDN